MHQVSATGQTSVGQCRDKEVSTLFSLATWHSGYRLKRVYMCSCYGTAYAYGAFSGPSSDGTVRLKATVLTFCVRPVAPMKSVSEDVCTP